MTKDFKLPLSDALWKRLLEKFQGDENKIKQWITQLLENTIDSQEYQESKSDLDASGLKDYLQSSKPGSREYGAKGQGW